MGGGGVKVTVSCGCGGCVTRYRWAWCPGSIVLSQKSVKTGYRPRLLFLAARPSIDLWRTVRGATWRRLSLTLVWIALSDAMRMRRLRNPYYDEEETSCRTFELVLQLANLRARLRKVRATRRLPTTIGRSCWTFLKRKAPKLLTECQFSRRFGTTSPEWEGEVPPG